MLLPLLTLVAIVVGVLCGNFPQLFGGDTIGEIARSARTRIDPAPYAFAIWLPIFVGQLAFAVHQMLPSRWDDPAYRRIRLPAMVNSLAAGGWSIAYSHHLYAVAWTLMLVTLASLIALVRRLGKPSGATYGFSYVTYHANLAWISVAAMVNTAQFFHHQLGWSGAPLTPVLWASILVGVAAVLGAYLLVRDRDVPFAAVIAWALVAIGIEQSRVDFLPMWSFALAAGLGVVGAVSLMRAPTFARHA
jgi:hypothetical protein